ncbi:MAG TPA: hypothetical protein VJZ27_17390, partial [Aggregatilineales bacterium]|nr:hypothetical protein [Aggregatilineales bacterium]
MANQPQLGLTRKHQNNGLFSDYYLNERVGTQFKHDLDLQNEAQSVFEQIKLMRERIHPETLDEAQLEAEWIQPVFRLLGHHYKVQIKIRYRDRGNRRPDYLF